jgi:hypothetical protein
MKPLFTLAIATFCAAANAIPLTLPAGPIFVDFRNAEQYSASNDINNAANPARPGVSEGNWGLVEVDRIRIGQTLTPSGWQIDPLGPTVFTNGLGPQILGIFYGVQHSPGSPVVSTGGSLDLYWWDSATQDVAAEMTPGKLSKRGGPAGSQYSGFTCLPNTPGCSFLVRLDFEPGADVGSQVNTIASTSTNAFETYFSVDTSVQGAWTDVFDSNYFTLNPAQQVCGGAGVSCLSANDVRVDGTTSLVGAGGWDIAGTDIIGLRKDGAFRAFDVAESGSLPLAALGLALLALARRPRRECGPWTIPSPTSSA